MQKVRIQIPVSIKMQEPKKHIGSLLVKSGGL